MNVKITLRDPKEKGGIVCMPLVSNVPAPRAKDWNQAECKICGAACWESDLTREVIAGGTKAACTMCALKAGMNT